jgi:hypothetical protein
MKTIGGGNQCGQVLDFGRFRVFANEVVRGGFISNFLEVLNNKTEVKNLLDKLFG